MPITRLSSKGQLVLPKAVRETIGIGAGTVIKVTARGGKIILEPIIPEVVIGRLYGKFSDVDFLKELEGEHQKEISNEAGS